MSSSPPLLRVATAAGAIEIRGRHAPPAGLMRGIDLQDRGRLRIETTAPELAATYVDSSGTERSWDVADSLGPLLFEEETYHLWVDGVDDAPHVRHRDPLFARDITHRPEKRSASGTFNLQRQVGRLPLTIAFGATMVQLELEVVPTKIDYATDYEALVADVSGTSRGLALAYMRSTHRGAAHGGDRATEIEWLTTLRQEMTRLQQALARISAQPYRHLLREVRLTPNYKVRRLDSATRRAITRGKGAGPVDEVDGLGPVRRMINNVNAVTTLDTPEHRWLHLQLRLLHRQLLGIAAVLANEARRSTERIGERRRAEQQELRQFADRLERLLELDVLRAATRLPQPSPPSLTLISAPGYREAYRILTDLRLGLAVQGEALDLQSKDIHDLYELWAFTEIVRLVAIHTDSEPDVSTLVRSYSGGLRIGLSAGALSDVPFVGEPRGYTVSYNRVYPGPTGEQKPDIVIRVSEHGRPDLVIVLDAKYRVDATPEFRTRHGAPGPPIDAINALHRYRDAIVSDSPTPMRPVVRGAALFPLTLEEADEYEESSSLFSSLASLGIGALPFLPRNTALVDRWIAGLLALPSDQLAWNGPSGPQLGTSRPL